MANSLFEELKRRNVIKVGIAYLVLAWVVIQVTQAAVPAFNMPDWVNTVVFYFGIVVFPFVIFVSWAFEVTPQGIKRESEIAPEESITAHTGRKLDFIIIGLLVVALGYFIYESRFTANSSQAAPLGNSSTAEEPKEVNPSSKGSSIAVLPFVNMSSDKEQEYFSDGISEEILNVLAKIPKLHVTSRSSAFFYKDTKINISEVATKLGVKNILEGSVRKSGNRIRITAQLIEAGSDKHLWSETYDRDLTDIFAVQDEISAAIVEALKTELGLDAQFAGRNSSNVNLKAHNEYLQGRFFIENRNQADIEKALAHFNKSIEYQPDYAPAWMGKGWAFHFLSELNYGNLPSEISLSRARSAIEEALRLDPDLPETHGIMGLIELASSNRETAISYFEKAIKLNPNYADAMVWYGLFLFDQPKKRLTLYQKALQLSPMSLLANNNYAHDLILLGEIEKAREIANYMLTINASQHLPYSALGNIFIAEGKYAESIFAFESQIAIAPDDIGGRIEAATILSTLGLGEQAAKFLEGKTADPLKYWFKGNDELYLSRIRETFPRRENDSLGYWVRGVAEARAENYSEASSNFRLVKQNFQSASHIFSYLQSGNTEEARGFLDKAELQLNSWLELNAKYFPASGIIQPIEIRAMEIDYLRGNIDKAILNLKQAMKKNYIVNIEYQKSAIYKELRKHPDWPTIMAESNKRAAEQRETYFKLAAVQ